MGLISGSAISAGGKRRNFCCDELSLLSNNGGHATPELGKPTWSRHLRPDNSHLSILLQYHIELIGDFGNLDQSILYVVDGLSVKLLQERTTPSSPTMME